MVELNNGEKIVYTGDSDEDNISCDRCGRTTHEVTIYLGAAISWSLTGGFEFGNYCADCRDDVRASRS